MPFIDIAFQAEVSRFEDPEFEEFAERNCNENPKTRSKAIEELRNLIYVRGECKPRRMDDAYLLRFLRCRRFIPASAHRLMVRYEGFRRKYAYLYHYDVFGFHNVKDMFTCTIPDSPDNGRITIMKIGKWDPDEITMDDALRSALLMDELAVMQPKLQILGVTIILDMEGMSIRNARYLNTTVADQVVNLLGKGFPLLLRGLHVINYSWLLNSLVYLFKHLVSNTIWNSIYFHGSDVFSLHKHIQPQYLPEEYGGTCKDVFALDEWLSRVNKYKDEYMVNELKDLGFAVD